MLNVSQVLALFVEGVGHGGRQIAERSESGFSVSEPEGWVTRVFISHEMFLRWCDQLTRSVVASQRGHADCDRSLEEEVASLMMLHMWEALDAGRIAPEAPPPVRVTLQGTEGGRVDLVRDFGDERRQKSDSGRPLPDPEAVNSDLEWQADPGW